MKIRPGVKDGLWLKERGFFDPVFISNDAQFTLLELAFNEFCTVYFHVFNCSHAVFGCLQNMLPTIGRLQVSVKYYDGKL